MKHHFSFSHVPRAIRWQKSLVWLLVVACIGLPFMGRSPGYAAPAAFSVFPDDVLSAFTIKGAPTSVLEIVPVTGQSFDKALKATTPADIPISPYAQGEYQISTQVATSQTIVANDVLDMTVWLRSSAPEHGQTTTRFVFERSSGDYAKSINHALTLNKTWTQYHYRFRSIGTYAPDQAQLAFYMGYSPQAFEIGGLEIVNLGQDALVPPDTYDGRDPQATWRTPAQERIEQHRKGDFSVTVRDQSGHIIPNASVHVKMLNHAFEFGTEKTGAPIVNPDTSSTSDAQKYREHLTRLFNTTVTGLDLKWAQWEDLKRRVTQTLPSIKWLRDNGMKVRGHTLIWPGVEYLPSSVDDLLPHPAALRNRVDNHILNEMGSLRGLAHDWDIVNEPYHNHDLMDVLGKDEMVRWYKLAQQADPQALLTINDYHILSARGEDKRHQDFYYETIKYLLERGAPVQQIGFQSHFAGDKLTSMDRVWNLLNHFGTLGLPMKVTEFDIATNDEQLQADYTRDYLTMLFSHPQVDGFLMWGFWESEHWIPSAAMFRKDWSPKPNAHVWEDLVYRQWWTDVTGTTGTNGQYKTRGFYGDYQVDVTVNGQTNTIYTNLPEGGKNLQVTFDPNATPPTPPVKKPLPPPTPVPPPVVPVTSIPNGLNNTTFEDGTTTSWYGYGPATIKTDSSTAHNGTQSLAVTNRTADWQGVAQGVVGSVKQGQTYQSSAWIKLAPGSTAANASIRLRVNFEGAPSITIPLATASVNADGWTQVSGSALASWSGTPRSIDWYVSIPGSTASFWLDDTLLQVIPPPKTAIVEHINALNGKVQGTLQMLTGEPLTINGGTVSVGLYVPGGPAIRGTGETVPASELPARGNPEPSGYTITTNKKSSINAIVTRTDPSPLPEVQTPPTPSGTRDVTINQPGQSIGDPTTLRNLTLNRNAGEVALPGGTYGTLTANGGATLILGDPQATSPVIYNVQGLVLNAGSTVKVVGPVVLNLAKGPTINNGTLGDTQHPSWLTLNVASGDVTVNNGGTIAGSVIVPNGRVTVNNGGLIKGLLRAAHLTLNHGGLIQGE